MNLDERQTVFVGLLTIVAIIGIGFMYAPQLPDQLVTGWTFDGTPKDSASADTVLFAAPAFVLALLALFLVLPRIDPLKENIEKFREYYNGFIVLMMLYALLFYGMVIWYNLGILQNPTQIMLASLGMLFYYSGVLFKHAEQNWFIGIRTPWTLSSEDVWNRIHELGSILFKVSGMLAILSILTPVYSAYLALGPVLASSAFLFVYSYWLYRGEE